MIYYPKFKNGATIGVTAPSSGVPIELHKLLENAIKNLEEEGFKVVVGNTIWTQNKAKSTTAPIRAQELMKMFKSNIIDCIFPPWGGELLIEILDHINYSEIKKWILGYSDISLLSLTITLVTGTASAHCTNLIDLRGQIDCTTQKWKDIISLETGESILQKSSIKYQNEWDFNQSSSAFNLTEKTMWKTVANEKCHIKGRLLGGCIDVIRHIVGTPFGNVKRFQKKYINNEPIIWYLESSNLSSTDIRRSLMQMKYAGWFDNCSGILFGRCKEKKIDNYTNFDVYKELFTELQIPVVYDIDCGHLPPQITFINGAYAEIFVNKGEGTVIQSFIP